MVRKSIKKLETDFCTIFLLLSLRHPPLFHPLSILVNEYSSRVSCSVTMFDWKWSERKREKSTRMKEKREERWKDLIQSLEMIFSKINRNWTVGYKMEKVSERGVKILFSVTSVWLRTRSCQLLNRQRKKTRSWTWTKTWWRVLWDPKISKMEGKSKKIVQSVSPGEIDEHNRKNTSLLTFLISFSCLVSSHFLTSLFFFYPVPKSQPPAYFCSFHHFPLHCPPISHPPNNHLFFHHCLNFVMVVMAICVIFCTRILLMLE